MNISGKTAVFALLGDPVAHSRSPAIWRALFEQHRFDGAYVALRVPASTGGAALATSIRTLGLAGVNLTIPHKTSLLPYLDVLTPSAQRAGAVNFVRCLEGELIGDNTDGGGFVLGLSLEHGVSAAGRRVLLLGAGGAARALAAELLHAGAERVVLLNRTVERAEQVVVDLRGSLGECAAQLSAAPLTASAYAAHASGSDLVVNCTGAGARETIAGFDFRALPDGSTWCDLNYWDAKPPLLQIHRDRGLKTQDGLMMLVCQAVLAFQAVSGARVDPRLVVDALRKGSVG